MSVVDDDEQCSRSLSRFLRGAGMRPIEYPSAEAFLADAEHHRFHCLVFDIHLGGISGIELGRYLTAEGGYAPFICITEADPELRVAAEAAGCAAFLLKTDSGAQVLDAIRNLSILPTER